VGQMADEANHKKLKIVIDILSLLFVALTLFVFPIWNRYDPDGPGPNGGMTLHTKLLFLNLFTFAFGFFWLIIRYADIVDKKYLPFTRSTGAKVVLVGTWLLLMLISRILWG
jgi:hypothetical protein